MDVDTPSELRNETFNFTDTQLEGLLRNNY